MEVEQQQQQQQHGSDGHDNSGRSLGQPSDAEYVLPAVPSVTPAEHTLSGPFAVSFSMRQAKPPSGRNYAELVKVIGVVASVEQFWQLYSCLKRPAEHTTSCDYHVFRYGVKPMWEDPANAQGGKWFVRMRPEVSNRVWESALLSFLGETFTTSAELCGLVLSMRPSEVILSFWTRSAEDTISARVRDDIMQTMAFPANTELRFKIHHQSMQDRASFRQWSRR